MTTSHEAMILVLQMRGTTYGKIDKPVTVTLPKYKLNYAEVINFRYLLDNPHPLVTVSYKREDLEAA